MSCLFRRAPAGALLICILLFRSGGAAAEPVTVRYTEGLVHGFLVLRTLQGDTIAAGDLSQGTRGGLVTSRLMFRFKDGSLYDETVVFSQRGSFRLLSDHLVQKGPSFDRPMDVSIDARSGRVAVRYTDKDGKEKVETEQMELPLDLANGMVFTLLKNIAPGVPETTVSMVAATPKPRLVKLKIVPVGQEPFSVSGVEYQAMHYVVKVEIGGVAGVVVPLLGKQPPDHHVWIIGGKTPGFVKAEGSLYLGGPPWKIELASPVWPKVAPKQP